MIPIRTPQVVKKTDISFAPATLESGTCGLFRAPLDQAADLMPSMKELIDSAPVPDPWNWEVDIKVHMLMPGQYPCIPNWHTDMVPRDESGTRFDLASDENPPMYLWISAGPETEFLPEPGTLMVTPGSHQELARYINEALKFHHLAPRKLSTNAWYSMDQFTPHRGTQAKSHGWRVFARLTHNSMAPHRPQISVHRRHAQVYLDAREFGW